MKYARLLFLGVAGIMLLVGLIAIHNNTVNAQPQTSPESSVQYSPNKALPDGKAPAAVQAQSAQAPIQAANGVALTFMNYLKDKAFDKAHDMIEPDQIDMLTADNLRIIIGGIGMTDFKGWKADATTPKLENALLKIHGTVTLKNGSKARVILTLKSVNAQWKIQWIAKE